MDNGPSNRLIRLPRPSNCLFSEEKADRAVRFINEHCRHTKGKFAGQLFNLRPWQEVDIREIFGRVNEDGTRQIRTVYKEIPKKNGKSEECAALGNLLLFADDEPSAEIYIAAADRDQASIIFNVAAAMVRADPDLLAAAGGPSGIINSSKRIVSPDWESYLRAVSAEVGGKHGFNSHGVIFDEIHAQKDRRLWEVMTFGAGDAREQPLTVGITTSGIPGESPVAEELHEYSDQILRGIIPPDPTFYPVMYAAPENAPWDEEEVWRACNPALGDFLNLEAVRTSCERAKRMPSEQNSFRRLRLNQWVKQETRFIPMEAWDACDGLVDLREMKGLPCYAGLDLSTKLDITALALVFLDGNGIFHLVPYFWIPSENIRDRPNIEADKYRQWMNQGYLTVTEGNVIDFKAVRDKLREIRKAGFRIRELAFDPMFATQLAQDLQEDGLTVIEVRQGFRQMSEATIELQSALIDGKVRHGGHPMLRWMADCMTVKQDANGAVKTVKPDRLKHRKRIDGIVAAIMGMSRAILHIDKTSVYARRDGIVI